MPATLPFFSDMLIDADANIWLREYLPPALWPADGLRWFIFDPDGRLRWSLRGQSLYRFVRPSTHLKPEIGRDYVLTSARDGDGVESVVLYRLRK